ncbi:M14 family zinc carboxypeptidase [Sulfurivirga sp.]|uniref:M14 family zinc carboxypeptidase n=1 Tax=Sulfurivirga sp. TaxID=2614236 RepID=UPI0025F8ED85|nr:M14 family zinc carboxypeptidase [Sulfurivirga sp.]
MIRAWMLAALLPAAVSAAPADHRDGPGSAVSDRAMTAPTEERARTRNRHHKASATSARFCRALARKLRTVTYAGCHALSLEPSGARSVQGRPLMIRRLDPAGAGHGRVLFIGGIHGDEWAAVSLTYLWLQALLRHPDQLHHQWLFVPVANPDGLLRRPSRRTNAHGVDLNRNFPSPDWRQQAHHWWTRYKRRNPRYYPGPAPASEPETRYLVQLIHDWKPDVIISLHAPWNLLDYDGPEHAVPQKLGRLRLRQLGTYPGSLGRYAGEYLKIPVLTIELKSAARMPDKREIAAMQADLDRWIEHTLRAPLAKAADHPHKNDKMNPTTLTAERSEAP